MSLFSEIFTYILLRDDSAHEIDFINKPIVAMSLVNITSSEVRFDLYLDFDTSASTGNRIYFSKQVKIPVSTSILLEDIDVFEAASNGNSNCRLYIKSSDPSGQLDITIKHKDYLTILQEDALEGPLDTP
jgi:hypothetical protein